MRSSSLSHSHSRICLHTVNNYHLFTTLRQSTSIFLCADAWFWFSTVWAHLLKSFFNRWCHHPHILYFFFLPGSFIIFLFALFNSRNGKNIDTHLFNVTKLKWHIYSSSISSISSSGSSYSLPFAAFSSWYTCYWPACVPAFSPSTYVYAVHSAHNTVHCEFCKMKINRKSFSECWRFFIPIPRSNQWRLCNEIRNNFSPHSFFRIFNSGFIMIEHSAGQQQRNKKLLNELNQISSRKHLTKYFVI